MAKSIYGLICFVLFILLIQPVVAISSDMKDSYLPGETIFVKISGNILEPIGAGNVEFKRGHILVPFDYDLKKLGEDYYLWALAPETAVNYSMTVKDISTYVSGNVREIDYQKNFSVSGNLTDYSVKPGFILTDSDFEIKVQLNEDLDKVISTSFVEEEEKEFVLKPGENTLKFSISNINQTGLYNLTVGKYEVPAYIKINKTTPTIVTNLTVGNLTNISLDIDTSDWSEEDKGALEGLREQTYCSEFPGKLCSADQVCSGDLVTSAEGPSACCVHGACTVRSETGSSLAWIGWLIAAIVLIAVVFMWIRYKRIKADKNPLEKKVLSIEKKTP